MGKMKIYSSHKQELNPLAKFAGKDLWVECYYYAEGEKRWRFFKVLKANAFESTVTSIPARIIYKSLFYKNLDDLISDAISLHLNTDEVDPVYPVNVLSTDDLYEMFNLSREQSS